MHALAKGTARASGILLGRWPSLPCFPFRPVKREIPSASLWAGSSLRLRDGYPQDDEVV